MGELETQASVFATAAHGAIDQRRKYTNEPYINHPKRVVELVRAVPHTEAMLAAAWLHDVVEDCGVTLQQIHTQFGCEVASLVASLTDISCLEDGSRAVRREIDRQHTALGSPEAKTIKLADLVDNTLSIVSFDHKFARVYLAEKKLLLQVLREGNKFLWDYANEQVEVGLAMLELEDKCQIN